MTTKEISIAEVQKHKTSKSLWIIIHNNVYDVTSFLAEHPGGEDSLLDVGGKDGTAEFEDVGHSEDARELLKKYQIGRLPLTEQTKPVSACCLSGKGKQTNSDKSWRTYDGSCSSHSRPSNKSPRVPPNTPKPERRVQTIKVPLESSNLKWILLALAGALVIGVILKKKMG